MLIPPKYAQSVKNWVGHLPGGKYREEPIYDGHLKRSFPAAWALSQWHTVIAKTRWQVQVRTYDVVEYCSRSSGREAFSYTALADASKQIRLLRIKPNGKSNGFSLELSCHDLASAPRFTAVSYTWGPEEPKYTLMLNGQSIPVRRNCWYALWQSQLHSAGTYFWLDAICINQDDQVEKSLQVQMMADIFEQAQSVFVSIGPHQQDSAYLFAKLRQMETQLLRRAQDLPSTDDHNIQEITCSGSKGDQRERDTKFAQLLDALVSSDSPAPKANDPLCWYFAVNRRARVRINRSLAFFGQREYWERLWVLQELIVASDVRLMCGRDILRSDRIEYLSRDIQRIMPGTGPHWPCLSWTEKLEMEARNNAMATILKARSAAAMDPSNQPFSGSLFTVLDSFGSRLCSDPRDRIFGLGRLIQWPPDQTAIIPDYGLSAVKLAIDAMRFWDTTDELTSTECAKMLRRALRFGMHSTEIQNMVSDRQRKFGQSTATQESYKVPDDPKDLPLHSVVLLGRELANGESGDLTASLLLAGTLPNDGGLPERNASVFNDWCETTAHWKPRRVTVGNQLAALVCGTAEAGDVLAVVRAKQLTDHFGLVLRRVSEGRYVIIGQAVFVFRFSIERLDAQYDAPPAHPDTDSSEGQFFEARLSAEDTIMLVCQDDGMEYQGFEHNLQRLVTAVSLDDRLAIPMDRPDERPSNMFQGTSGESGMPNDNESDDGEPRVIVHDIFELEGNTQMLVELRNMEQVMGTDLQEQPHTGRRVDRIPLTSDDGDIGELSREEFGQRFNRRTRTWHRITV